MDDWARFVVAEKRAEAAATWTLRLEPEDGGDVPRAQAGQYLTLRFTLPGEEAPQVRCYSLSHAPERGAYEVTIKEARRPDGEPGRVSGYINRALAPGALVELRPPAGSFVVEPTRGPLVFVAGGIGITPFMSMLRQLDRVGSQRRVHLFHGVRSGAEHPFAAELRELAARAEWLELHVRYSRPGPEDRAGEDYDEAGRIDLELLQEALPPSDELYHFFVCGPAPMLESISAGLAELGVPQGQVHLEAFQAQTVAPLTKRLRKLTPGERAPLVRFARSEVEVEWDPEAGSLLDFALSRQVFLPFACATGHCGTCASALLSGEVDYVIPPQFRVREGQCLPCIAQPATDVVLDL